VSNEQIIAARRNLQLCAGIVTLGSSRVAWLEFSVMIVESAAGTLTQKQAYSHGQRTRRGRWPDPVLSASI
jgi:hypothetical protein